MPPFPKLDKWELDIGSILRWGGCAVFRLGSRKPQETAAKAHGHGFAGHQIVLPPGLREQNQPPIDYVVPQSPRLLSERRLAHAVVNQVHHCRSRIEFREIHGKPFAIRAHRRCIDDRAVPRRGEGFQRHEGQP